jgi:hypothetical protein
MQHGPQTIHLAAETGLLHLCCLGPCCSPSLELCGLLRLLLSSCCLLGQCIPFSLWSRGLLVISEQCPQPSGSAAGCWLPGRLVSCLLLA